MTETDTSTLTFHRLIFPTPIIMQSQSCLLMEFAFENFLFFHLSRNIFHNSCEKNVRIVFDFILHSCKTEVTSTFSRIWCSTICHPKEHAEFVSCWFFAFFSAISTQEISGFAHDTKSLNLDSKQWPPSEIIPTTTNTPLRWNFMCWHRLPPFVERWFPSFSQVNWKTQIFKEFSQTSSTQQNIFFV